MKNQSLSDLESMLNEHFGLQKFRPGQAEVCQRILKSEDVIAVMPTGSGKSLCYQLPGIMADGVVLIVSPLIALAQDQADHLKELGFEVAVLNSYRTTKQIDRAMKRLENGELKFVITTPERLQRTEICSQLKKVGVSIFVVDEAHCVCQWGNDFRPDYLSLRYAKQRLGNPSVLALTATASPDTVTELKSLLGLTQAAVVRTGIYRQNLALGVTQVSSQAEKSEVLSDCIQSIFEERSRSGSSEGSVIVYCATTSRCDEVAKQLDQRDTRTVVYHGKIKKNDRAESQREFMQSPDTIAVATNAFGLGIDKPNIRSVIHYDLPGSLDAYYQEVGRAGRDNLPARCSLLYERSDLKLQRFFSGGSIQASQLATAHHLLSTASDEAEKSAEAIPLKKLKANSPLGITKLRQCLTLLATANLVTPVGKGRWQCIQPEADHAAFDRIASRQRELSEIAAAETTAIEHYCELPGCRWDRIRDYLGDQQSDTLDDCQCDQCDSGWSLGLEAS